MKRSSVLCVVFLLACCITQTTHVTCPAESAAGDASCATEAEEVGNRVMAAVASAEAGGEEADTTYVVGKSLLSITALPEFLEGMPSGFLLGSPVGITSNTHAAVTLKDAGFDGVAVVSANPKFERFPHDLLRAIGDSLPDESPILAMSLGTDVLVVEELEVEVLDGVPVEGKFPVLDPAGHGWSAVEFSVEGNQVGTPGPDDEPLAADIQALLGSEELNRTVFSYIVPRSHAAMLPSEWSSVRAMDAAALELEVGEEIHGLSMHMALFATDLDLYKNVFTERPLDRSAVSIYFTLRQEFLAALTEDQIGALGWLSHPNSSTIYRTDWSGTEWKGPTVYLTAGDLGLADLYKNPVIDGLSIDVPEPGSSSHAEVMFSLANVPGGSVPAESQVQYVKIDPATTPRTPKRVAVKKADGNYGSLGQVMGAGRGIGDLCIADPFMYPQRNLHHKVLVPDEFFVAWRLGPDSVYSSVAYPPGLFPHPAHVPPMFDFADRPAWPRIGLPRYRLVPQLGLAVSGYRQARGGRVVMRTCMSWPRPLATVGRATVEWGLMSDYRKDPSLPGVIHWIDKQTIPYVGRPLTADHPLRHDGMLRRPGDPPAAIADQNKAMVAKWTLRAGGRTYISPIAALRY